MERRGRGGREGDKIGVEGMDWTRKEKRGEGVEGEGGVEVGKGG